MDSKKSFNDYLKIIKEEKDQKEQEQISSSKESKALKEKQILKEKNKSILEEISIKEKNKPKKSKKFICPEETTNVALNLKNRQKAIDEFGYGPLNPLEEENNKTFWEDKKNKWKLESTEQAKTSLCRNCAAFVITKDMLKCISDGLNENEKDSWDIIDAGQLGYCEAFDFKCSALRTCDAWIVGGPITDKKKEVKND